MRWLLVLLLFAQGAAANDGIMIEPAWIEMPDGVRLSADLYMPSDLEAGARLPVLLEYLPNRKMESRSRNYSMYSFFLARGYVIASVDFRGTGNSEGRLIPYEYSDIELDDGEIVIDRSVGIPGTFRVCDLLMPTQLPQRGFPKEYPDPDVVDGSYPGRVFVFG